MIGKEKIRLDLFQDSLIEGDILIDSNGDRYKFIQFGYCQWVDSCTRCKGKIEVKYTNGFKDYACFGSSWRKDQWSTLWHISDRWIDDKDFEL